jgi:hypothetical protein
MGTLFGKLHGLMGNRIDSLADSSERVAPGWSCCGLAGVIGVVPLIFSYATGLGGHQEASAILLAWLLLPAVRRDRLGMGLAVLATAFAAHSSVAIALSWFDPQRMAAILPGAEDYWQKQWVWITTGEDPENATLLWLKRHLLLAAAATVWSIGSLGVITFQRGFFEVDLMNYYNGRLLEYSQDPLWGLLLGWHIWSVLRGVGFLFVTFEVVSLGYQFWTWRRLSPWRTRGLRLAVGLALLIADGAAKHLLMQPVQQALAANLCADETGPE